MRTWRIIPLSTLKVGFFTLFIGGLIFSPYKNPTEITGDLLPTDDLPNLPGRRSVEVSVTVLDDVDFLTNRNRRIQLDPHLSRLWTKMELSII